MTPVRDHWEDRPPSREEFNRLDDRVDKLESERDKAAGAAMAAKALLLAIGGAITIAVQWLLNHFGARP